MAEPQTHNNGTPPLEGQEHAVVPQIEVKIPKPYDPEIDSWSESVSMSLILGILMGGVVGYRRGRQPAQESFLMYSGALSPHEVYHKVNQIRSNYIWMTATKYSVLFGGATATFNGIYLGLRYYRKKNDPINLTAAGLITGCLCTSPLVRKYGALPLAMGAVIGGGLGLAGGLIEYGARYAAKQFGTELDFRNNVIEQPKPQPTSQDNNSSTHNVAT